MSFLWTFHSVVFELVVFILLIRTGIIFKYIWLKSRYFHVYRNYGNFTNTQSQSVRAHMSSYLKDSSNYQTNGLNFSVFFLSLCFVWFVFFIEVGIFHLFTISLFSLESSVAIWSNWNAQQEAYEQCQWSSSPRYFRYRTGYFSCNATKQIVVLSFNKKKCFHSMQQKWFAGK